MAQKKRIEKINHPDKRTNIPTKELRGFVDDDERVPQQTLYQRDPSLDPQLVWTGKDEQDSDDLEVDSVPIYIQEKIQPQAIIENIRATAREDRDQFDFFSDFNGIEFEDLIDFYQHEQNWSNRMILGDSLLVMNSLAEKELLKGQVQMIYIDPPYGIKFGSNWQVSTRKRDVKDGKVEDVTRQPEQIKAYRDTWTLGIHSYLSYLRDRLAVARELLTESGSVFVQISNENVHLARSVLDEVFGSENCVATIVWKKAAPNAKIIKNNFNYLLWYTKALELCKSRKIFRKRLINEGATDDPRILALWGEFPNGEIRTLTSDEKRNPWALPEDVRVFRIQDIETPSKSENQFELSIRGNTFLPKRGRSWRGNEMEMNRLKGAGRISETPKGLGYKFFVVNDSPVIEITNWWDDTAGNIPDMIYVVQTNHKIIERCLLMTTDPGDLVLDPTCGSGTTAYVAESWGRRWITIDTSRVALALARTRLMEGTYPYYLLADSPAGVMKEAELTNDLNHAVNAETSGDIKKGFVYKRVPHITLKSIANNPEIDDIHAKWQGQLEQLRAEINKLAGENWEEWEIPRPESTLPKAADESPKCKETIEKWWELRRERQEAIDDAITRHSENEILYDQPFKDNKRLRVTGPFTVESLSPHRVLSSDLERNDGMSQADSQSFEMMIIDNLKKAGVQNTKKTERLKFDRIERYAGEWIRAEGEYTEKSGETKRAGVSIGPEHGTVSPEQIQEAAKEAVKGLGFDLLIICGFAFDPHTSEERDRYGKLKVWNIHMNPDLMMGEELLKKTGAGNLFMAFGEPDVEIDTQPDGQVVVEIRGVDLYDPTMGCVRSSSTDEIACWFIDSNYNSESFFVRHAYFTGSDAEKSYKALKKALQAEINKEAWESLYDIKSQPFAPPETGKIAVKVINHYGDEILKVYDIKN